ncbi:MAG TPA: ThiF family adenylyltransferase [Planctomycetota bacterium]|nr:ThiF family adenylyltransferase [Planctomycetota bacterium]
MQDRAKHVTIVGLGNIGAETMSNVSRMAGVERITCVDRDVYTEDNLTGQAILEGDVGRAKARVQKRNGERANRRLRGKIRAVVDDVRNVPMGWMRSSVILGCLDSRSSRRWVLTAAWRLGVPVIDAGVNATDGLLARVTTYVPGEDRPCLECGWDDRHYAGLEQSYPCLGGARPDSPTNAPLSLGMLAGGLQSIECAKLLGSGAVPPGREEIVIDAAGRSLRVSSLRRNPMCLFDHEIWHIEKLDAGPDEMTLGECLHLKDAARGWAGRTSLALDGHPFVRRIQCPGCGRVRDVLRLSGRLNARSLRCRKCGETMAPLGFYMTEQLEDEGDGRLRERRLDALGFLAGDVFTLGDASGGRAHYELGGDGR